MYLLTKLFIDSQNKNITNKPSEMFYHNQHNALLIRKWVNND